MQVSQPHRLFVFFVIGAGLLGCVTLSRFSVTPLSSEDAMDNVMENLKSVLGGEREDKEKQLHHERHLTRAFRRTSGMLSSDLTVHLPPSIGRSWVDMSLGQASQSSTLSSSSSYAAARAIDGNQGTYSHTSLSTGQWWQVSFDFAMKVTGVEILLHHFTSTSYQRAPLAVSVDGVACALVTVIKTGSPVFVPCDRPRFGTTVRIQQASEASGYLQIYEVRVEEESTGRDEVVSMDVTKIICPFLSTLVNEKVLQGCVHTNETLLQVTMDAGLEESKAKQHVQENFLNNPSGQQDICDMEGALNEHKTSTQINDCHTDFEAYGPCQKRHEDTPASCTPRTEPMTCGAPNATAFEKFWAKLKKGNMSSRVLSITELTTKADLVDVVDGNPVGMGTIAGSYGLLLDIFGFNGSIHKSNLERLLLQRRFPSGYVFGRR